jgi:hypothetical protein
MTDERHEPDFAYDTEPGPWGAEDDAPTEVDPQTEKEREEESRKVALFFEKFLRSLDLKHLRERRDRELVHDCNSNVRDFVAYSSESHAPARATKHDRTPRSKVLLEVGTDDRTAPTVVLSSKRPLRWRLWVLVLGAGLVGAWWLLARTRAVSSEPQAVSRPTANLVQSAGTTQPLAALRPAASAHGETERSSEPAATVMRSEKPWKKTPDRAVSAPVQTVAPTGVGSASSPPSGSDPVRERIVSW